MNFSIPAHRGIILAILLTGSLLLSCQRPDTQDKSGKTIMMIACQDYGINTYILLDVFARNGWNTTIAGLQDTVQVCAGTRNLGFPPLATEILLDSEKGLPPINAVVIPPGAGHYLKTAQPYYDLLHSDVTLDLIRESYRDSIPVFAMCAGVRVLAKAGIISGKQVTGSNRFSQEYISAGAIFQFIPKNLQPPISDGRLITAVNGLDFSFFIGEELMTAMNSGNIRLDSFTIKEVSPELSLNGGVSGKLTGISIPHGNIIIRSFCAAPDGGDLYAGSLINEGASDFLLIRMNSDQQVIWAKTYGGIKDDYATCCLKTEDGFFIGGYTYSFGAGQSDVLLMKLGLEGELKWKITVGGSKDDKIYGLALDLSGNLYAAGYTNSSGHGYEDILLVKISPEGNLLWSKTYGGDRPDLAHSIYLEKGGNIVLGGTTLSYGDLTSEFFFLKTDSMGNEILSEHYGNQGPTGYGFDFCNEMVPANDGGFLFVGHTDCRNAMSVWVVKTNHAGVKEWDKIYDASNYHDFGQSIIQSSSGDIFIGAYCKNFPGKNFVFDNSMCLIRADAFGNELEKRVIEDPAINYCEKIGFKEGKLHLAGFCVDQTNKIISGITFSTDH